MSSRRSRRTGRRGLAICLVAVLALSGCGMSGGSDRDGPEWAHDPAAGRYYRPGVVMQGPELLEEHYPEVAGASLRWITEGRFTDPGERVPFPAPDDYWWQAVVQLSAEQAAALAAQAAPQDGASGGSGGTDGDELGTVPEGEVLSLLTPALEDRLETCTGEWLPVMPALAREGASNLTVAGDLIELAALCESSDQLVTSSTDM